MNGTRRICRRGFLKSVVVAGVAPSLVPARVLGAKDQTPPSGKITLFFTRTALKAVFGFVEPRKQCIERFDE